MGGYVNYSPRGYWARALFTNSQASKVYDTPENMKMREERGGGMWNCDKYK